MFLFSFFWPIESIGSATMSKALYAFNERQVFSPESGSGTPVLTSAHLFLLAITHFWVYNWGFDNSLVVIKQFYSVLLSCLCKLNSGI